MVNWFPLTAPPPYSPSSAAIKEPTNPNVPQIPKVYPYHGFGLGKGTSPLGGLPYSLPYPAIKPPIWSSHFCSDSDLIVYCTR
ncbi:hypothetical protein B9Z19DRAFT_1080790 [Tuber borchii]|uniref:Uncharacterized protein n=1 Tax=Tuber borchii TaxID=42251 RepID=A0A2T6ZWF1_TUBBO|nr:hypothetical protein B9Z19DRAFT_1080790 [Tuber borchii]